MIGETLNGLPSWASIQSVYILHDLRVDFHAQHRIVSSCRNRGESQVTSLCWPASLADLSEFPFHEWLVVVRRMSLERVEPVEWTATQSIE